MGGVVIGIPSRNEAGTIRHVVRMVDQGLSALPDLGRVQIVNADNDSDDGTPDQFSRTETVHDKVSLNTGRDSGGKGRNVLAILQHALAAGARAVALFDADVRSIEPAWVEQMLSPLLRDEADFVTPIYTRNRYEGNTTNHVVFPYLYGIFGQRIRQPIAGEFALSSQVAEQVLRGQAAASTLLYGIDVHLTANALLGGYRIAQVRLTRKLHNPGFPKIVFMSGEVIDSLFRVLLEHRVKGAGGLRVVRALSNTPDDLVSADVSAVMPDPELVQRTRRQIEQRLLQHRTAMERFFPQSQKAPQLPGSTLPRIDAVAWCEVLATALEHLCWETLEPLRECLVVLYLSRVFTYWLEIDGLQPAGIDALLNTQAERLRSLLLDRWAEDGLTRAPASSQAGPAHGGASGE